METGNPGESSDGGSSVEIKIKTLDAQTYTMRVDRDMPIPALKEQLAGLVGVAVPSQRLICRGKVLRDDQLLSSYNVEDGHTLHLVVRPPQQPPATAGASGGVEDGGGLSDGPSVSQQNRGGHVSHSVLMGTINIPDGGEGAMPDLNRIISAVLSTVGLGHGVPGGLGVNTAGVTAVIPDALTTMSQYVDRLEQGFASNEAMTTGGRPPQSQNPVENIPTSGSYPAPGPPISITHSAQPSTSSTVPLNGDTQEHPSTPGPQTLSRRLPTPAALGSLVRRVQGLLSGGAGTALSRLAGQLENEPSITDASARAEVQLAALRDGNMIQQLGALLLELGRTTQNLRMGQSPAESVVNAGPAVFISPTGPNPMMIQPPPLAFHTGGSLGAVPIGTAQPNGGVFVPPPGANLGPRSIDIHIHSSDFGLPSASPSSSPSPSSQQQPASRAPAGTTTGAPSLTMRHMRQIFERVDSASGGQSGNAEPVGFRAPGTEETLSMRQLIDRAVAEQRTDQAAQASSGGGVGHYQGAFVTFDDSRSVRVLPVRGRQNNATTAQPAPASGSTHTTARVTPDSAILMHHPIATRLRDSQAPVRPSPLGTNTGNASGVAPPLDSASTAQPEQHTVISQPTYRAQIHVQGLSGQGLSHSDGISFSLGPSGNGEFRIQQAPISRGQNLQGPQQGASGSADIRTGAGTVVGQAASTASRVPVGVSSGRQASDAAAGDRNPGTGSPGIGVTSIMESVGPLLQQMIEAYHNRSASRQQNDQVNQQEGRDNQHNSPTGDVQDGGQAGHHESQQHNHHQPSSHGAPLSEPPATTGTCDGMDIDMDQKSGINGDVSSLTSENQPGPSEGVPVAQGSQGVQIEDSGKDSTAEEGDNAPPVGLGLGVLQPLPSRPRRRSRRQPAGDGIAGRVVSQAGPMGQGAPTVLQNFMSQLDRSESRPQENASEHSMGQQLAGLLPLLGGGRGVMQSGGSDILAPLMSNPAISDLFRSADGNATAGLGGIMSQLMGSPLVGNIYRQVMAGMGDDEVGAEEALPSRLNRGSQGGLDLGAMLHHAIPVVSQMLGSGRTTDGAAHQASETATMSEADIQGGQSRSRQDPDGSKGWEDALTEEEVPSWTETLAADFNRQQSMPPQRPFSDVYARGSPVAKRQKTGLEGTAQKLEKGESPEDILRSMAENAAALSPENNGAANELHASELVQHVVSTEGLAETPILAMAPDSRMRFESSSSRRRSRSHLESDNDWLRLS